MDASFQEPVALAIVGVVAGLFVFLSIRRSLRARREGATGLSACGGCGTCPTQEKQAPKPPNADGATEPTDDPAMPTSCRALDFAARLDVYRERARASGKV